MALLPTEIKGNIALINGIPWAFGRFIPYPYGGFSVEEKLHHIRNSQSFFKDVILPGMAGCLWLIQKEQSWSTEFEQIQKIAPAENRQEILQLSKSWLETIEEEGVQTQYEFVFGMEIPSEDTFRQSLARHNPIPTSGMQRWIRRFLGTSLNEKNLTRFQRIFQEQTAGFSIEELTEVEIMDLYQRHNYRGIPRPKLSSDHEYPPKMNFLMPNPIEDCGKYVRIDHADGSRYVTFLTVSLYPSQILAPGFDLLYDLQSQGIPVEVQVWWKQKSHKEARLFAERRKKAAISNSQHIGQVQAISLNDQRKEIKAEHFEDEINTESYPLNVVQLVFCVTAEYGEAELEYYVKMLERFLEKKGIVHHRSTADQSTYYDSWCPQARWLPVGYSFPMLPDRTGAITIPGASDQLGDPTGLPKGILLSNGSVVRLNFSWGARSDQTSNIIIVGQSGSGKTHLADDIVRDTMLTTHSRGIYVDVKGEHNNWHHAPGLEGRVQYKFLDGYENPGILDPFHLIQRVDDYEIQEDKESKRLGKAREIAYDMILTILDIQGDQNVFARRNDILQALDEICNLNNPSLSKVIDALEQSEREEAREMGHYLQRVKELPLGKLIFGEPKEGEQLQFPKTGLIILGIKNINLPEEGKASSHPSERTSEACMTGISVLVEQFLIDGKEKGIFSYFVGDEGKFYMQSQQGGKQIERNLRLGRSAFCGNIICTQNPEDIPDSLLNHVSVYICLGTKTDKQTYRAMEALGVSLDNEEVFQELKRLGIEQSLKSIKGKVRERKFSVGYMRDLAQRVGMTKFITPQDHVRNFLKTRPDLLTEESTDFPDEPKEKVMRV